jgi:hypothetical protein
MGIRKALALRERKEAGCSILFMDFDPFSTNLLDATLWLLNMGH